MFIKPNLDAYFNASPLIAEWIRYEYHQARTLDDLVALVHRWLDLSEETSNETRKRTYKQFAYYLYSLLTNKSYESGIKTTN